MITFAALMMLLAQTANVAQDSLRADAPVTVNSIVIILGAVGVLLGVIGTFVGTIVNAYLTLRNGMKSDINSAKADATGAKLEVVHAQINNELVTQTATIAQNTKEAVAAGVEAVNKTQTLVP